MPSRHEVINNLRRLRNEGLNTFCYPNVVMAIKGRSLKWLASYGPGPIAPLHPSKYLHILLDAV
jgi:hypothetical protein